MNSDSPFHLSRIQAEGWNTARAYLVNGDPSDVKRIASLNPYNDPMQRSRWFTGFNSALTSDGFNHCIATMWAKRSPSLGLQLQKDS
jgi:hypothetical protein